MTIDLNCDAGEGFGRWELGEDLALFSSVTSANIACGYHAGDPALIARTVRQAKDAGVTIGAHISYPDLLGFGRRFLDMSYDDLRAMVIYQIGALRALAASEKALVRYVKPHGALYHAAARRPEVATAVRDGISASGGDLAVMCEPGSVLLSEAADAGLTTITEGFADRGYNDDGTLVARSEPGALIVDAELVAQRVRQIAVEKTVTTISGRSIPLAVDSVCIHGDSLGAADLARSIRSALERAGVRAANPLPALRPA